MTRKGLWLWLGLLFVAPLAVYWQTVFNEYSFRNYYSLLRKAHEETGLADLRFLVEAPIDIDVHEIPARPDRPPYGASQARAATKAQTTSYSSGCDTAC